MRESHSWESLESPLCMCALLCLLCWDALETCRVKPLMGWCLKWWTFSCIFYVKIPWSVNISRCSLSSRNHTSVQDGWIWPLWKHSHLMLKGPMFFYSWDNRKWWLGSTHSKKIFIYVMVSMSLWYHPLVFFSKIPKCSPILIQD